MHSASQPTTTMYGYELSLVSLPKDNNLLCPLCTGLHKPGYTECFIASVERVTLFQEASSLNKEKRLFSSKVRSAPHDAIVFG